ncbi:MAG: hypothetical protein ABSE84_05985, partial [Isosphaeraceae bacterium]
MSERGDPQLVHDLGEEFKNLCRARDRHARGHKFEVLVFNLLRRFGLQPYMNPGAAEPRQIDLAFRWRKTDILVEVKWREKPIDASDVDN